MKSNLVCIAFAIGLQTLTAQAQGDLLGADEMAEAIVLMTSPVWTGPRTPAPDRTRRPQDEGFELQSPYALLTVHAKPGLSEPYVRRVMAALELARARLDAMGWPSPISDGDLGGGPDFDLYLTPDLPPGPYSDGVASWSYLDRASTFAAVSPSIAHAMLDACVTEAYAEALLLSMDPAEANEWRRASAAWLTWEVTGHFGCEEAVSTQQSEPFRSWVVGAAGEGDGGALWLAYLSARHDATHAQFVRDVWGLASQRTWEGAGLRADPDLWSAIEAAVEQSGDHLLDNAEDLAVLRWFVGRGDLSNSAIAAIDSDARVPVSMRMTRLPTRVVARRPLESFGSAYVVMDRAAWGESRRLRAWLQGEYGVRWSFVAVQLDDRGNEISRIASPRSGPTPEAYLPIEIDDATRQLLFVVTNLSSALPDADEADVNERAFEIIIDRAED